MNKEKEMEECEICKKLFLEEDLFNVTIQNRKMRRLCEPCFKTLYKTSEDKESFIGYYNSKNHEKLEWIKEERKTSGTVKVTDKEWNRYSEKHDPFDIAVNLLGVGRTKEAQKIINDGWKLLYEKTKTGHNKNKQGKIIIDRCYIDYERKRYADRLKRFLQQFRKPF